MDNTPTPRLSPREKALKNPKSMKLAIAAYCYHDCQSEESANSHKVKFIVKNCARTECPLWPFRGWQNVTGGTVGKRNP